MASPGGGVAAEIGQVVTFGLLSLALILASWLAVNRRSYACWCFAGGAGVGLARRVTAEWVQRDSGSSLALAVSTSNDIWLPMAFAVLFLGGLVFLAQEWGPR